MDNSEGLGAAMGTAFERDRVSRLEAEVKQLRLELRQLAEGTAQEIKSLRAQVTSAGEW